MEEAIRPFKESIRIISDEFDRLKILPSRLLGQKCLDPKRGEIRNVTIPHWENILGWEGGFKFFISSSDQLEWLTNFVV
jgi:hypothetical protein